MPNNTGHPDFSYAKYKRTVVVAPHPDDETLGCGGLVSGLRSLGGAVYVIFVTDGSASHPNSKIWPSARLAEQREKEAKDALVCLGLQNEPRMFLRLVDAAMPPAGSPAWQGAVLELREVLQSFSPDLAIIPWRRDPHCDHRASWQLFHTALKQTSVHPEELEYAIWLEEFGKSEDYPRDGEAEAVRIDVSRAVKAKRAAIAAHKSQVSDLIDDDSDGFRLTPSTIARLTTTTETFWRPTR
jgi:LmbE family N-acetylglucosaminyl deacetylase